MSRHPEDKLGYNEATSKVEDHIKGVKEETFQTYLQNLTTADTDYSLWKVTRRLK
jgi:hypothetical protein